MTPSARLSASIELLESILATWQTPKRFPADKLIDQFFKARRYAGSKDRAYIGELVYWCLRHLALLRWHAERDDARLLVFVALHLRGEMNITQLSPLCTGEEHAPSPLTPSDIGVLKRIDKRAPTEPHILHNYPEWMQPYLERAFGSTLAEEVDALNAQAPMDVRANAIKCTREELQVRLIGEGFECVPTRVSPVGLRLEKRAPIFTAPCFKEGWFEVQDEGSQIVALLTDAKAGMRVIDFCAGAGGKTLAIAAQMNNKGRILALDTSKKRLDQSRERLARAGVDNVSTHVIESETDIYLKRHRATADRVLVDAPCSGTGTWRRNPDLKWRFTEQDVREVTALQQSILQQASRLVKVGGRIIYATCSILREENEMQVDEFLKSGNNFRVVCAQKVWNKSSVMNDAEAPHYLSLTPHRDGVDGFFAAVLERLS